MGMEERPRKLVVELSRNCNLHCQACGFGGKPVDPAGFMDPAMMEGILASDVFLSDVEEVRLNGRGESTIHPEFERLVARVRRQFPRARLTMFTNLMFPRDEILDVLNANRVQLFVSMDSHDPARLEALRRGANHGIMTRRMERVHDGFVVFTLQASNVQDVLATGLLARGHGLGFIVNVIHADDEVYRRTFKGVLDREWDGILAQFSALRDAFPASDVLIPDQVWGRPVPAGIATTTSCGSLATCPNATSEIMIAVDGTIFPCNMFNPTPLGNLHETSLEQAWQSEARAAFVATHKQHAYCIDCQHMVPLMARPRAGSGNTTRDERVTG